MSNQADRFETRAIHAGQEPDRENRAIMTPVYFTSTYKQDAPAKPRGGYEYSRTSNPTRTALQDNLAALVQFPAPVSIERLRALGITYVVVATGRASELRTSVTAAQENRDVELVGAFGDDYLYRVRGVR